MERQRAKSAKGSALSLKKQAPLSGLSETGEIALGRIELPIDDVDVSDDEAPLNALRGSNRRNLPKLRDLREDVFFRAEYLYLHNLINLTGHNIRKACELSGLSRSRLYTLLKKYRITFHDQLFSH